MAINRYSTISEKDFDLYVPPVQAIGAALETAQKTYDTNFMFANELKNKYINALPQDRARANELQTGWENQVNDLVKKYNGDFSTASKDLYLLQKDIEKQYRQGGEANAIETNYNLLQDSKKRNQERLAKKDIKQMQYSALYDYFDKNYKGVTKGEDGTYQLANIPELASAVDTFKDAQEAVKGLKPRKKKVTEMVNQNGRIIYNTREIEAIDPDEVQAAIYGSIGANEGFLNYATQLAQLRGQDPNELIQFELDTTYDALGPTHSGIFSDTQEVKSEADPFALAKQKHQYALAEEYNKQKGRFALAAAKGELQTPESIANIRVLGSVNNDQSKYKPIDVNEGIRTPGQSKFIPGLGISAKVPFTTDKAKLEDVINNPRAYPNVNTDLLKTIKADNPNYTYTQVLDQYNRSLPRQRNGEAVFATAYRNSDTGIESAKLIAPQLLAGNSKAIFIGNDSSKRPYDMEEQQALGALAQEGKVASVGQSRSFSADVPVGEVFPVNGGYVVVASNSVGLNNYNEYIAPRLFKFIGEGRLAGDRVPLDDPQGRQIQGIRLTKEDADPKTGLKYTVGSIAFVATDNEGRVIMKNGEPDYFTKDGRLANEQDIEEMMLAGDLRLQDTPKKTISANNKNNAYYERQ